MEFTKDINFNLDKLVKNKPFTINYSGKLFQEGSEEVFITYGYGEKWNNTTELKMKKTNTNFSAENTPKEVTDFNFCFKNNNNIWDNNCYKNYSIKIEEPIEEVVVPFEELIENVEEICSKEEVSSDENEIEINDNVQEINSILDKPPVLKDCPELDENKEIKKNVSNFSNEDENVIESTERKTFNIDAIIDEILNSEITPVEPVHEAIQQQVEEPKIEKIVPNNNPTHVNKTSLLVEDVLVPFYSNESTGENNGQFLPVDTNTYSKFFTFKRKIKLALYRILHSIPKLLTGNFKKRKTNIE